MKRQSTPPQKTGGCNKRDIKSRLMKGIGHLSKYQAPTTSTSVGTYAHRLKPLRSLNTFSHILESSSNIFKSILIFTLTKIQCKSYSTNRGNVAANSQSLLLVVTWMKRWTSRISTVSNVTCFATLLQAFHVLFSY